MDYLHVHIIYMYKACSRHDVMLEELWQKQNSLQKKLYELDLSVLL